MTVREYDWVIDGIPTHCWEGGSGYPVVLMHGSGPGVSTLGNWRRVLEPLVQRYHVLAFDLVGFGLSGRKAAPPFFDLDLWCRQAAAIIARLPPGPVGVIAHSLSAAIALRLAASEPRIAKLVTTGAMGAAFDLNPYLAAAWTRPRTRAALRDALRPGVHDPSGLSEEFLDQRMAVLERDGNGAYFEAMFDGDRQRYIDACAVAPAVLGRVRCQVLMMHGRDDPMTPFETTTLAIARLLPQADILALADCRHGVAQDQPAKFLGAATAFLG